MTRTWMNGETRREQILWAAVRLASQGVKHVTLAGIAEVIGLVPSAIYRHFQDKASLMDAALQTVAGTLLEKGREAGDTEPDALTAIRKLGRFHAKLFLAEPGILQFMFSEVGAPGEKRSAKLVKIMAAYRGLVADIVVRGQRLGQIRRDIAPEDVVFLYVGALIPPAFLNHLSGGEFNLVYRFERSFDLIEEMARVTPGGKCAVDEE